MRYIQRMETMMLSVKVPARHCRQCGDLFPYGPLANRLTLAARRSDADFCSNHCKVAFHNARKLVSAER